MKETGIVRRIDELGRIVLPIELRRTLGVSEKDYLEIFVENGQIVLKKYEPSCVFCGSSENVTQFREKNICKHCIAEISRS